MTRSVDEWGFSGGKGWSGRTTVVRKKQSGEKYRGTMAQRHDIPAGINLSKGSQLMRDPMIHLIHLTRWCLTMDEFQTRDAWRREVEAAHIPFDQRDATGSSCTRQNRGKKTGEKCKAKVKSSRPLKHPCRGLHNAVVRSGR